MAASIFTKLKISKIKKNIIFCFRGNKGRGGGGKKKAAGRRRVILDDEEEDSDFESVSVKRKAKILVSSNISPKTLKFIRKMFDLKLYLYFFFRRFLIVLFLMGNNYLILLKVIFEFFLIAIKT